MCRRAGEERLIVKLFSKKRERWPLMKYDPGNEPYFLFILTPPYSGSTVLCKLINTSHRTMLLNRKGEGQWLIPGMSEKDRWDPDKVICYDSVKSVWLNVYQYVQSLVQTVDVVIEKSPPNMMRVESLARQFQRCSIIANNRDPYASCASFFFRKYEPEQMAIEKRIMILSELAGYWLMRSAVIRDLTQKLNLPLVTYEAFCADPAIIRRELPLPADVVGSIEISAKISIKDYKPQPVLNQNERQVANLTAEEIAHLSGLFEKHQDTLGYFGYQILG